MNTKQAFSDFISGFYLCGYIARAWWARVDPSTESALPAFDFDELGRGVGYGYPPDNAPWRDAELKAKAARVRARSLEQGIDLDACAALRAGGSSNV